jgi:4-diphosphocytidyl-2-C-methyl-D-erythritol kinase
MKTQGPFRVASPAKVTLHLRILRRRSDGYHEIRIALAPVALYDRLTFALGGSAGLALALEPPEGAGPADAPEALGPPEDNLVLRAARAFQAALGEPVGGAIRLAKRIPAGAGLGGGSGNAAATLVALNRWHGMRVGPDRLHALATGLGADVPFFLEPRPAWAEGIGERLTPLGPLPALELLVVKPPLAIATGAAYAACWPEAAGGPAPAHEPDWSSVAGVVAGLFNAFEAVLLPRHPVLGAVRAALREAGALGVSLSGSGSALFGVFADAAARDAATARLTDRAHAEGWRLFPCRTLAAHRYDLVY